MRCPNGTQLPLKQLSPALVGKWAEDAWKTKAERDLAGKWTGQGWEAEDDLTSVLGAGQPDDNTPTPIAATAVTSTINAKGTARETARGLAAVAADAVWTKQRLWEHGLAEDPTCTKCKAHPDTMHHRAWCCPESEEVRKKHATKEQINRARAEPKSLLWSRGWLPGLAELVPQPAHLEMRAWDPEGGERELDEISEKAGTMTGYIFVDGSADTPADTRRRRAGWAVVEVEPYLINGQLVKKSAVWGTTPAAWPQSAQAGEYAAAVAAAELGKEGAVIFTDCLSVLRHMKDDRDKALHPSRPWAGAYRLAHGTLHGAGLMQSMQKVKAHQVEVAGETVANKLRRLGNDWADNRAKAGADMHPKMPTANAALCNRAWHDASTACKVLGEVTALWPDAAGMLGRARRPPTREERRKAADARKERRDKRRAQRRAEAKARVDSHSWARVGVGDGEVARCVECLAWRAADIQCCPGPADEWNICRSNASAQGHLVQQGFLHEEGAGQEVQLMLCARCGAYSTGVKAVGLSTQCSTHPTSAGAIALARVAEGRHPKSGRHPRWCTLYR